MKQVLWIVFATALAFAQDQAKPDPKPAADAQAKPDPSKPDEAKPADAKAAEAKAEDAKPAADAEKLFEIQVDVGTRWQEGVRGNYDTYRSIVNLGEGVRLLDWDGRVHSGNWNAITRGSGWGGDPAQWLNFSLEKSKLLRINLDHRSTAYFNALPSFANPLLDRGILFNQRAFDTRRRLTDFQVELFPGARWIPFFGFMRDRGFGRGVSNFVSDANEYPVLTNLNDRTNLYRGGVRYESRRMHATLEQGGIQFNDDQTLSTSDRNTGNLTRPFLGQTLVLTNLLQSYAVDGSSIYSKGLFTAQPVSWLDFNGAFQFSQPRNDVNYQQANSGRFVDLDSLLFFNAQNIRLLGAAKQPHITANVGVEVRPLSRIRVIDSFMTDRLHNSSTIRDTPLADRLEWNYSQHQIEAIADPITRLTLRGGYRYVWGDGAGRPSLVVQSPIERGQLKRHVALGGAGYRLTDRAFLNADVEIARSDRVIFRTSLSDYERIRMRGRYQLLTSLRFYGTVQVLNNSNPPKLNRYEFRSHQTALGLQWLPGSGKTLQVTGEYGRSALKSDLDYFVPQNLQPQRSLYRENAHTLTGYVDWRMAIGWTWQPHLTLGGSAFLSDGTRPTNYYQPVMRLSAPVHAKVDVFAEYRYYGLTQQLYSFEGFRTHQGIVGIRIHR